VRPDRGSLVRQRTPGSPVFIVDGARTPFLTAPGSTAEGGGFTPVDMAVWAGRPLLLRQPFAAADLDEVVLGCVHPSADEPDPGRLAAYRLGASEASGWTVRDDAGSGLRVIDAARRGIVAGDADLVLAGGAEAQSRVEVTPSGAAAVPLRYPVEPVSGMTMAQAADALGYRFGIRRADADGFALESRRRFTEASGAGFFGEIAPIVDHAGAVHANDSGMPADLGPDDLAALAPVDRYGNVTAGNSCHSSDGAAWLLLASELACKQWSLTPRGRIADTQWAALAPSLAGLGPVVAATPLLERNGLTRRDVAAWELDESFAAHVLACLAAWEQPEFCRRHLGLRSPVGAIDRDRLNVDGGALALGQPLAAGGVRIVLHLLEVLRRRGGRWGIAALATAGGQGGALLVEAL
jgi:acetyl-CoA C-acetyltransferase